MKTMLLVCAAISFAAYWGVVDSHESNSIEPQISNQCSQIKSLLSLTDQESHIIREKINTVIPLELDRFIAALQRLVLQQVSSSEINSQDAMRVDTRNHEVLVENEHIRILWTTLTAGKTCVPHTHQWPSVILIVSGLNFLAHKADGSSAEEEWPPGVYEIPGDTESIGFTNISECDFKALYVELKKTMPRNTY